MAKSNAGKNIDKLWTITELRNTRGKENITLSPLIGGTGYSLLRAEDGIGTYVSRNRDTGKSITALGTSFVFETGEIWAIDTALLSYAPSMLFQGEIEKNYSLALGRYVKFLSELGIQGPFRWIAGINGAKGRSFGYPPPPGKAWIDNKGPVCAANQIIVEGLYDGTVTPLESLLPFFKKIFEKCGRERPSYLPQK